MSPFPKPALLTEKQRLRIQTRHNHSVNLFGYNYKALFWTSAKIQEIRFKMLAQILNPSVSLEKPLSILDVGCGFGDLKPYLESQGFEFNYTGIDISPSIVQSAGFKYPNIKIYQGDIFDFKIADNQFDYVLLSGALNEVVETELEGLAGDVGRYAKAVIKEMYRITRCGVAFNLLDARNPKIAQSSEDLQSFLPHEILAYCNTFANHVKINDDYLDNDFTVYLTP